MEEQPYKIPDNWVWTRLGNVSTVITGNTPSKKENKFWENGDIFFVKPNDLNEKILFHSEEYVDNRAKKSIRMIPKYSTLLCCIGSIGKNSFSMTECCTNQQINSIISKEKFLNNKYTYYFVNSSFFQNHMLESTSATTVAILNKTNTENLFFLLPPLEEQKRIVEKLDYFSEKINRLKALIEEVKADIENRKISILDKAFKGELTAKWREKNSCSDILELLENINKEKIAKWEDECAEAEKNGNKKPKKPTLKSVDEMIISEDEFPYEIPDTWRWVRLGDIFINIKYGYTDSAKEVGIYKFLRITDIQNNKVDWENVPYCNISEEEFKNYKLNNRDVLIARTGGTIGKTFLINNLENTIQSVYASYLIKMTPIKNINEFYFKKYFETDFYWKLLEKNAKGTGQPNINVPALSNLYFPLPPLEEQKEIVRILDEVLERENKISEILKMEEQINLLEKSILNKAFRGELGTGNINDVLALEMLRESLLENRSDLI
nr:restriction endonuclease subunit S [Fusobacterium gastrosuis]